MGSCQEKKSEQHFRGVKDSFTVNLLDFKFFYLIFLIPCIEKDKTGMLLHRHPKPRRLVRSTESPSISEKFMLETAETFISSFNQSMDNTGKPT